MEIQVNYFAVLLAAIVSMVVGFAWYSPMLFAKRWMKAMKLTAEDMKKGQKEMGKWYGISFILSLITAYVLSHVMVLSENFYHYTMLSTGLITAFWMWLGFVMPVQFAGIIFSKEKNFELFAINTGYQLVAMLAMGAVLGFMAS